MPPSGGPDSLGDVIVEHDRQHGRLGEIPDHAFVSSVEAVQGSARGTSLVLRVDRVSDESSAHHDCADDLTRLARLSAFVTPGIST